MRAGLKRALIGDPTTGLSFGNEHTLEKCRGSKPVSPLTLYSCVPGSSPAGAPASRK